MSFKQVDVYKCADHELIGLALVAIGYDKMYHWQEQYKSFTDCYGRSFNPLENAEHSLLLQCELGLTSSVGDRSNAYDNTCVAWVETTDENVEDVTANVVYSTKLSTAAQLAVMRAITIVAAKIGKDISTDGNKQAVQLHQDMMKTISSKEMADRYYTALGTAKEYHAEMKINKLKNFLIQECTHQSVILTIKEISSWQKSNLTINLTTITMTVMRMRFLAQRVKQHEH